MNKQPDRKTYNSLQMAIRRDGFEKSGVIATLLLRTFLNNGGELKADVVVDLKLCEEGQFKVWRERLINKGWLVFDKQFAKKFKRWSKHKPGIKLHSYLNIEKPLHNEMASAADVTEAMQLANAYAEKLTTAIARRLIMMMDPPVTEEKIERVQKEILETREQFEANDVL